ncbi:MAG TPA: carcinine hydrolase/isopenicillin-N N-acyltransferase family protein [Mycobacteriales bacterium]|nr:carcinine hydrolase/isopenicillin-N N-acyltransferase family protein [Mycobacteriales bacterium]
MVGIVLVTAGLAGCSAADPAPVAPGLAAVSTPAAARGTPAAPLTPTEERTLASLTLLDDHPLYEMTYAGALPPILPAAGAPDPAATTGPSGLRKPFGCTVFLAGDPARPVLGRNFDWDPNPALILHTNPPGGTATTSVVDISYLGYDRAHLADLDTPAGRRALLRAPLLPFDGMNEHGLAVGMAAEETAVATRRPGRALVGSVRIMRLVLEHARTVRQAVAVLGAYDLDFNGGPPLHYFVADATGASAIVEFVGGRFTVIPRGDQPWQVMVNFQQATSTEASRRADRRWRTATARLAAARGRLDPRQVLGLLADVRQGHTQWSVAYDLKGRRAYVVVDQDYRTVRQFQVD